MLQKSSLNEFELALTERPHLVSREGHPPDAATIAEQRDADDRSRLGEPRHCGPSQLGVVLLVVDDGAASALVERNRSLLPAGIVRVEGSFARGDVVAIETPTGQVVGRGLTNYAAADLEQIRGKKTADVRALLKERAYDEVVHRDNLVLL